MAGGCGARCNTMGGTARGQAAYMAATGVLLLLAIIALIMGITYQEAEDCYIRGEPGCEEHPGDTAHLEIFGLLIGTCVQALALLLCIPRCCAPFCCQADMPDVPPPCPCGKPAWLDCPLLTGLWIEFVMGGVVGMMEILMGADPGMLRGLRLLRILWIVLVLVGFPVGIYKYVLMKNGQLQGAGGAGMPVQATTMGVPVQVQSVEVVGTPVAEPVVQPKTA